jgi:hypothetical protein
MRYIIALVLFVIVLKGTIGFVGNIMAQADMMRTDVCSNYDQIAQIC